MHKVSHWHVQNWDYISEPSTNQNAENKQITVVVYQCKGRVRNNFLLLYFLYTCPPFNSPIFSHHNDVFSVTHSQGSGFQCLGQISSLSSLVGIWCFATFIVGVPDCLSVWFVSPSPPYSIQSQWILNLNALKMFNFSYKYI